MIIIINELSVISKEYPRHLYRGILPDVVDSSNSKGDKSCQQGGVQLQFIHLKLCA